MEKPSNILPPASCSLLADTAPQKKIFITNKSANGYQPNYRIRARRSASFSKISIALNGNSLRSDVPQDRLEARLSKFCSKIPQQERQISYPQIFEI